ncbi:MAG: GDSL-type esterase/lipase family protein [Roseiflexaceae bacterium]
MLRHSFRLYHVIVLLCIIVLVVMHVQLVDAQHDQRYYDTGAPQYTDIWVDPLHGNDSADGLTPATAVQHLGTAWERIPATQPLTQTGYRILLQPGSYDATHVPALFTQRTGTAQYPIEIVAATPNTVTVTQPINLAYVAYVYIRDITVVVTSTPALSCIDCHHLLVTTSRFDGGGIVVAQSHHTYIEDSVIHASDTTGITLRAVYDSHIQQTRVTQSAEACIQLQSGSASIRIETNTLTACGTYGVVTGPRSTLESMRSPWIHYEAYDVTVANNIITATTDAGIGIYGAYNTVVAFNTLYDIGGTHTALAVGHAQRTCAGIISQGVPSCSAQLARRGWGTRNTESSGEAIPNRNIFIYNNLIVNPQTTQNQAHLAVAPAVTPSIYSGIPAPSRADENLQIVGNVFWNGDTTLPIGIEINSGCMVTNPTCNTTQLRADNRVNTTAVTFVDPVNDNWRLEQEVPVAVSIPSLPDNRPLIPLAPLIRPNDATTRDFLNMRRGSGGFPGAYAALIDSATITPPDDMPSSTPTHTPAHNTPTSSRTRTSTRTRSWTRTASVTMTTSRTRTISPTHTPSTTRSTHTASRTQTASRTATASHTASHTPTSSSTRTASQTSTPSNTRSTYTASRTQTASRTATATATMTKTRTTTLTRTASRTRTASATYTVTPTSTPVERVPIIPQITSADKAYLREILQRGIARRNNPRVFAKIGDSITASTHFLQDIGCNGENLANYHSLYDTVTYFRQHTFMDTYGTGWCNVSNSFNALSPSAQPGWSAYYALFSDFLMMRYQGSCREPFNTPIACELRLKRPSIALIMFGSNDVTYGNISDFENSYADVVEYTIAQGVIPVLSTIPPRLDNPVYNARVVRYNAIIIRMAAAKRLPLWNYWLALQSPELIDNGLSVDRIHPNTYRTTQSADFSQEGLRYGYNQRNLTALQVLDAVRRIVILNGAPDQ